MINDSSILLWEDPKTSIFTISGFWGPVRTLICGFEYTKLLLRKSKKSQETYFEAACFLENGIWEFARSEVLESWDLGVFFNLAILKIGNSQALFFVILELRNYEILKLWHEETKNL